MLKIANEIDKPFIYNEIDFKEACGNLKDIKDVLNELPPFFAQSDEDIENLKEDFNEDIVKFPVDKEFLIKRFESQIIIKHQVRLQVSCLAVINALELINICLNKLGVCKLENIKNLKNKLSDLFMYDLDLFGDMSFEKKIQTSDNYTNNVITSLTNVVNLTPSIIEAIKTVAAEESGVAESYDILVKNFTKMLEILSDCLESIGIFYNKEQVINQVTAEFYRRRKFFEQEEELDEDNSLNGPIDPKDQYLPDAFSKLIVNIYKIAGSFYRNTGLISLAQDYPEYGSAHINLYCLDKINNYINSINRYFIAHISVIHDLNNQLNIKKENNISLDDDNIIDLNNNIMHYFGLIGSEIGDGICSIILAFIHTFESASFAVEHFTEINDNTINIEKYFEEELNNENVVITIYNNIKNKLDKINKLALIIKQSLNMIYKESENHLDNYLIIESSLEEVVVLFSECLTLVGADPELYLYSFKNIINIIKERIIFYQQFEDLLTEDPESEEDYQVNFGTNSD